MARVFFQASDGIHGLELWVTDGTVAGTHMVADIAPGAGASNPQNFFAFNNSVFFKADDAVHGGELWKSDGTTASLFKDINTVSPTASNSSNPQEFAIVNGTLFFQADDGTDRKRVL